MRKWDSSNAGKLTLEVARIGDNDSAGLLEEIERGRHGGKGEGGDDGDIAIIPCSHLRFGTVR